jgi:hypothetical protein
MNLKVVRSIIAWSLVISACLFIYCDCNPSSDDDTAGTTVNGVTIPDTDGDGILNIHDNDIDGDNTANALDDDIDGDGIPNSQDDDIDGDGIPNAQDMDIDGDGIPNAQDNDIDGDGLPNSQDDDIDGDGLPNASDPDPNSTSGNQNPSSIGTVPQDNQDSNNTPTGFGIPVVDTVTFRFNVTKTDAGTVITATEAVDLDEIRSKIEENDIELETFSITSFYVIGSPNSQSFINANAETRIVVEGFYMDGGTKVKVAETPAGPPSPFEVQKIKNLTTGLYLNSQLFASMPGYENFVNMIKDRSVHTVDYIVDIELLDALNQPGTLEIMLVIKITGKKRVN